MRFNRRTWAACGAAALATGAAIAVSTHADAAGPKNIFHLQRSPGIVAAGCLPHATARVVVQNDGPVEVMKVHATGLPKNTDFDLFVIQVPNAPFGVSWYQGDMEMRQRRAGRRHLRRSLQRGDVRGRTWRRAGALGPQHAVPGRHQQPGVRPDPDLPLGLWFNSPADAAKAGCASTVTPFNGEHNAGVQVLNTGQFADAQGSAGPAHAPDPLTAGSSAPRALLVAPGADDPEGSVSRRRAGGR